ncbi:MAG: MBL fold metallo-hydrolase [Betaproteobacteria bacterium]|nr:MBL fold metallo-hydrolase [Betaproteobacteria bacterium]
MQTWTLGGTTVTRIEEQVGPNDSTAEQFLAGLVRERFAAHLPWMAPTHYDPASDKLITSNHSWLIRTGRHTILLDSCAGNHKPRPWLPRFHMLDIPFLERLRAVGVATEDIDIVLCFSRIEKEHFDPEVGDRRAQSPGRSQMYDDSVLPVLQSGQALLLEGDHAIDDRMVVEPAPGHTPGHVILKLNDGGGRGLFCGDVLHHPVQVYEPTWNTRFCELPAEAAATRRRVLEHCAEHNALLFPTHFAAPHVAAIRSSGAGFRPEFVAPR